ncbi:putative DNA replication checkpoint protein tel2 [Glarea lozoyensis 74030]|uniref:Putative DNA replication checkpoint protein tel2 n=1 Tax=Glarea lozoyensis (strain ATCC 74030 / MF5533) TaxID=1104152 RepID=H0ECW2_GLAL7|nr:putative DNA replication checkpoint protein tel2 [Glarea lozoyensis 74030]
MDTILTPERRDDALIEVVKQKEPLIKPSLQATTPEEALEILKNEPDHEALVQTLRLNALFLGFKRNIQLSKDSKKTASTNPHEILAILLQALEAILEGLTTIEKVWTIIWESTDSGARKKAIWADFLGLVVGGKLLGSAAEADDINIRHWAKRIPLESDIGWKCCAELLSRSFRVGKTASSTRARFLGMVVGEALSSLVDKGENKMDFKVDEMQTTEAKWYKSMVNVADKAGELELLRSRVTTVIQKSKTQPPPAKKPSTLNSSSKISSIEEIESDEEEGTDNSEDDDDDLVPYGKPESDAEDSDEDATNVVRNKPTAPVYIRNLITYLRNTESYDHQKLGLSTAASLIRRKANFGTEGFKINTTLKSSRN